MTPFSFLRPYIRRFRWTLTVIIIAYMCGELTRQFSLYFSSRLVGLISDDVDKATLLQPALVLIFLIFLGVFLRGLFHNLISTYFEKDMLPLVNTRVSLRVFGRAHKHSLQFFNEEMSGRIAGKAVGVAQNVRFLYKNTQRPSMLIFRMIIAFFFLMKINVWVALSVSVFLALYLKIIVFWGNKVKETSTAHHNQKSIATGVLVDTLFNATLIKNDGHMGTERFHMWHALRPVIRTNQEIYKAETWMYVSEGVCQGLLQIVGLSIPFFFWMHDKISIADFVFVESMLTYLIAFGMNFANPGSKLMRIWGSLKDGVSFLWQPFQVVDKSDAFPLTVSKGTICFNDVTFFYKPAHSNAEPNVLFDHFNLSIPAGEKIGLVGHSGSGKSSLIKLLARSYDIQGGHIFIDDTDIADVTQDSLRRHIALIPQDPSLFNRTIMENIRYGNPGATDEEVVEAATKAYCHDFIMRLPNGYDSRVGERGIMLSGGERQRIAIARAILKNAPILILDEATSALDSESEMLIQKALHDLMKTKTVIAIAHRLSTLREMDKLVVMDKGRIIETGTHDNLLAQNGAYAAFYELQAQSLTEAE